jgi:hypothetical protein
MPAQDRFLTANQLNRVRDLALLGMVTPVTVERRTASTPPVGGDYGDDFLVYPETNESRRLDIKAWIYSTPTPEQSVDTGMIVTVNTYRMFVPVGTDILPGDLVHAGDQDYVVSDTTAEGSWLPLLTVSLRKRE